MRSNLDSSSEVGSTLAWGDGERSFFREQRRDSLGLLRSVLVVRATAERPSTGSFARLAHEYALRDELHADWAVKPQELVYERGSAMLILDDPLSDPLEALVAAPMQLGRFLHLAVDIAATLAQVHRAGLIHKDVNPANILVSRLDGKVRFTGFGIASRLTHERQPLGPPEMIAGTLAYMAPEQTGRINRSIDSRSDLYALGVTFYRMLTGPLPFEATDPIGWVHCHIAKSPAPPIEHADDMPSVVSDIIMKLLAKTAEQRYQTALGVVCDLRKCLSAWDAEHRIECFPLGTEDRTDRFRIPEHLYGREREVERLLSSLERTRQTGTPELVLVSGYSGIGKSALVNELHKALLSEDDVFVSGAFDEYERDVPYATLAQMLRRLLRPLLGLKDDDLAPWRLALRAAVAPLGGVVADLVPELDLIIGDQERASHGSSRSAQRRLRLAFRRIIGLFARPHHQLVFFFDDLQWLDEATSALLEDLLTDPSLRYFSMIGAYRYGEVGAGHPLGRAIATIKAAGVEVQNIPLSALSRSVVTRFLADAISSDQERSRPLADLIHGKTGGNPYFITQFLYALAHEGLLFFDHELAEWSWDIERINAKGYTDNVIDLMVKRLGGLSKATQTTLADLACIGSGADLALSFLMHDRSEGDIDDDLQVAVRIGLVERTGHLYNFVHDRVREAAYALIPRDERAARHLTIGRFLLANTPIEQRGAAIFEIVNQLNRSAHLITNAIERMELAKLNLLASQRAKTSTVYGAALSYAIAGVELLGRDSWNEQRDLRFALEFDCAECELLVGDAGASARRLKTMNAYAGSTRERAALACLRMDACTTLDRSGEAISIGLEFLAHVGISWSSSPTKEDAREEYDKIWVQIGDRQIEDLVHLHLMNDEVSIATIDVLTRLLPPAYYLDFNLYSLIACKAVNLSLEWGHSDGSCNHYASLSLVAGREFGDYPAGYRFGRLGCELVEFRGLRRYQAATYMTFGAHGMPWATHFRTARELLLRALDAAHESSDLTFAAYSLVNLNGNSIEAGVELGRAQKDAEEALAYVRKIQFGIVGDIVTAQLAFIRTLRGMTFPFGSFDGEGVDETQLLHRFSTNPDLGRAECIFWILKIRANVFASHFDIAFDILTMLQRRQLTPLNVTEALAYHFYGALSIARRLDHRTAAELPLEALTKHHQQLLAWAEHCPENFGCRAELIGAEIARLEGRDLDAMRLYEKSIQSARIHKFIHIEALSCELTASYYASRGFEEISFMYLAKAHAGYSRWGAEGKVRQLTELHPYLREAMPSAGSTTTIDAASKYLDLATMLKVAETISAEIELTKLIETLLRTAIEQAGAERGALILPQDSGFTVRAEGTSCGPSITITMCDCPISETKLPESLIFYTARTRESTLMDDASARGTFVNDNYIRERRVRSALCVPLMKQGRLIALLYLENNLASHIFTPSRTAILTFLLSGAATALENAKLYSDLQERESKIRRIVNSKIVGILIWRLDGTLIEVNDTFLRIVGYNRSDFLSKQITLSQLTPADWRNEDERCLDELRTTGFSQPYEKEYIRGDGSILSVLVSATLFEIGGSEGVTFVTDLTDRKAAEQAMMESEQRYRQIHNELAHANRLAAIGQLSASISHEITQPVGAAITYANAGLSWLGAEPPDLNEVRQALEFIKQSGLRAGEVIDRIRSLVKKTAQTCEAVGVNEAISEVLGLIQREIEENGILVTTSLVEDLPPVRGDRIQIQQVMLNLFINAIEAMIEVRQSARHIHVATTNVDAHTIKIIVRDSGPGLRTAQTEKLFESFYTTKPSGLGLGLSICRSIIEAHGGRLSSPSSDSGATFEIILPRSASEMTL